MNVFHLPDTGEAPAEARLMQWHVGAGDEVCAGQRLASVQTATALVDIPSPQTGRIAVLLAAPGDALARHAPLLEFAGDATIKQTGVVMQEGFSIGRHRHTEARLQQSTQRRSARTRQ